MVGPFSIASSASTSSFSFPLLKSRMAVMDFLNALDSLASRGDIEDDDDGVSCACFMDFSLSLKSC